MQKKNNQGRELIIAEAVLTLNSSKSLKQLEKRAAEICILHLIPLDKKVSFLIEGWCKVVKDFLYNKQVNDIDSTILIEFINYFSLVDKEFNGKNAFTKLGEKLVIFKIAAAINDAGNFYDLNEEIIRIFQLHFISLENRKELMTKGYDKAAENFLIDGVLSDEEDEKLHAFLKYFSLTQDDFSNSSWFFKIGKASILREIKKGNVPIALENVSIKSDCAFAQIIADRCKSGVEAKDFDRSLRSELEQRLALTAKITVEQLSSKNDYGLQAVDLFSYGVFHKHELGKLDWYEIFEDKITAEIVI